RSPHVRESVEQRASVDAAQGRAVAGIEDGHAAALVRAQIRDRVDQVVAVELDEGSLVHGGARVCLSTDGMQRGATRIAMWRGKQVEDAFRDALTEPDAAALPL